MKFYVTEEEKRLIDEKMKQLPIKQYGAYFRKMAIDGYILVVDRSDTKAYIRELHLLGLDSDTFYIYHVAAVMVDNLRRLLLGINLSDKAIMDFDFPGVGFPV